ncbi:MAG: hypothetical protein CBB72_010845 [Muricauda sp. TMED12]|nr:MAG: hypothetical protein CBB72_010845 [Muricauda sp. TMED12]
MMSGTLTDGGRARVRCPRAGGCGLRLGLTAGMHDAPCSATYPAPSEMPDFRSSSAQTARVTSAAVTADSPDYPLMCGLSQSNAELLPGCGAGGFSIIAPVASDVMDMIDLPPPKQQVHHHAQRSAAVRRVPDGDDGLRRCPCSGLTCAGVAPYGATEIKTTEGTERLAWLRNSLHACIARMCCAAHFDVNNGDDSMADGQLLKHVPRASSGLREYLPTANGSGTAVEDSAAAGDLPEQHLIGRAEQSVNSTTTPMMNACAKNGTSRWQCDERLPARGLPQGDGLLFALALLAAMAWSLAMPVAERAKYIATGGRTMTPRAARKAERRATRIARGRGPVGRVIAAGALLFYHYGMRGPLVYTKGGGDTRGGLTGSYVTRITEASVLTGQYRMDVIVSHATELVLRVYGWMAAYDTPAWIAWAIHAPLMLYLLAATLWLLPCIVSECYGVPAGMQRPLRLLPRAIADAAWAAMRLAALDARRFLNATVAWCQQLWHKCHDVASWWHAWAQAGGPHGHVFKPSDVMTRAALAVAETLWRMLARGEMPPPHMPFWLNPIVAVPTKEGHCRGFEVNEDWYALRVILRKMPAALLPRPVPSGERPAYGGQHWMVALALYDVTEGAAFMVRMYDIARPVHAARIATCAAGQRAAAVIARLVGTDMSAGVLAAVTGGAARAAHAMQVIAMIGVLVLKWLWRCGEPSTTPAMGSQARAKLLIFCVVHKVAADRVASDNDRVSSGSDAEYMYSIRDDLRHFLRLRATDRRLKALTDDMTWMHDETGWLMPEELVSQAEATVHQAAAKPSLGPLGTDEIGYVCRFLTTPAILALRVCSHTMRELVAQRWVCPGAIVRARYDFDPDDYFEPCVVSPVSIVLQIVDGDGDDADYQDGDGNWVVLLTSDKLQSVVEMWRLRPDGSVWNIPITPLADDVYTHCLSHIQRLNAMRDADMMLAPRDYDLARAAIESMHHRMSYRRKWGAANNGHVRRVFLPVYTVPPPIYTSVFLATRSASEHVEAWQNQRRAAMTLYFARMRDNVLNRTMWLTEVPRVLMQLLATTAWLATPWIVLAIAAAAAGRLVSWAVRRPGRAMIVLSIAWLPVRAMSMEAGSSSSGSAPPWDGNRDTFWEWTVVFTAWIALKFPDLVGLIDGAEAPPTDAEGIASRLRRNRQLFGAVIQAMPGWQAQQLHLTTHGDGVACLQQLSRDHDASDPTDLTCAMADMQQPVLSRQAAMSVEGLRTQYHAIMRAQQRIVRAHGTPYDDVQLCNIMDMLLPPAFGTVRQLVRRRGHATFNEHYNDYVSQVKAETITLGRHQQEAAPPALAAAQQTMSSRFAQRRPTPAAAARNVPQRREQSREQRRESAGRSSAATDAQRRETPTSTPRAWQNTTDMMCMRCRDPSHKRNQCPRQPVVCSVCGADHDSALHRMTLPPHMVHLLRRDAQQVRARGSRANGEQRNRAAHTVPHGHGAAHESGPHDDAEAFVHYADHMAAADASRLTDGWNPTLMMAGGDHDIDQLSDIVHELFTNDESHAALMAAGGTVNDDDVELSSLLPAAFGQDDLEELEAAFADRATHTADMFGMLDERAATDARDIVEDGGILDVSGHFYWLHGLVARTAYQRGLPSFTHAGLPPESVPTCPCAVCTGSGGPQRTTRPTKVPASTYGSKGGCGFSQCEFRCSCMNDLDEELTQQRALNMARLRFEDLTDQEDGPMSGSSQDGGAEDPAGPPQSMHVPPQEGHSSGDSRGASAGGALTLPSGADACTRGSEVQTVAHAAAQHNRRKRPRATTELADYLSPGGRDGARAMTIPDDETPDARWCNVRGCDLWSRHVHLGGYSVRSCPSDARQYARSLHAITYIAPSMLSPEAGRGLFARCDIREGQVIATMEQPVIFRTLAGALDWCIRRNMPWDAVIQLHERKMWADDALCQSTVGQVHWYNANHAQMGADHSRRRLAPSACAQWTCVGTSPMLVAGRPIKAGEEILYSYGAAHREDHGLFPTNPALAAVMRHPAQRRARNTGTNDLSLRDLILLGAALVAAIFPCVAPCVMALAVLAPHAARVFATQGAAQRPCRRGRGGTASGPTAHQRAPRRSPTVRGPSNDSVSVSAQAGPPQAYTAAQDTGVPPGRHAPLTMWVDTMAPYGVVNTMDAVVRVQDAHPNVNIDQVAGSLAVEAIVTVGLWLRLHDGTYRYVEVPDFQFVPAATVCLWPVQTAEDACGIKHYFNEGECYMRFPDGAAAQFARLTVRGRRRGYMLATWLAKPHTNPAMPATPANGRSVPQRTLWRRLAYPHVAAWSLVKNAFADVHLDGNPRPQQTSADDVALAKGRMRAKPYGGTHSVQLRPLEKLYMDFAGPVMPSVLHGFRYYCGVVDAATGYSRHYPCHGETAAVATACLAAFLAEVRAIRRDVRSLAQLRTCVVRADQGAAFTSEAFVDFVERRVQAQWSPACTYSPQQNGNVERQWQVAFSNARVLLVAARLPPIYHPYAVHTSDFVYNRMPSQARSGHSPYALLTDGAKPNVGHLRVFGCACRVFVPKDARETWSNAETHGEKLCDRALEGIYLGPDPRSPGHRVWLTGGKRTVITSRHVEFDEDRIPGLPSGGVTQWWRVNPPTEALPPQTSVAPQPAAAGGASGYDEGAARLASDMLPHDVGCVGGDRQPVQAVAVKGQQPTRRAQPTAKRHEQGGATQPSVPDDGGAPLDVSNGDSSSCVPASSGDGNSCVPSAVPTAGARSTTREQPKRATRTGHVGDGKMVKMARYKPPDRRFTDPTAATPRQTMVNLALLAAAGTIAYPTHMYESPVGYSAMTRTTAEMGDVAVPSSFRDAMRSQHKQYWVAAMEKELAGLMERKVWDTVKRRSMPSGANLMNCHFVYDLKRRACGAIEKWKARLVADGSTQKRECGDFDPQQIFSTVVKLSTVRTMLCLACAEDQELSSIDVRQAYLYADVEEELYMRMPPTLPRFDADGDELVTRLNRSLYGLRQSAKQWNKTLIEFLTAYGFAQSKVDTCLFTLGDDASSRGKMWLAVWVDDIVIAASSAAVRAHFVKAISERFTIEDKGALEWVLGVRVQRDRKRREIALSQELYIRDVLSKYAPYVTVARKFDVPLSPDEKLSRDQCPAEGSKEKADMKAKHATYMAAVGALLWLAAFTRPDLTYASSVLARFVANPAHVHFLALQRVLTYLHTTADLGLVYKPDRALGAAVYTDADWSAKFSTAGAAIYVYGGVVVWHSRLQRSVSHSTAEAEYMAASMAAREAAFMRDLWLDLGHLPSGPTPLLMDSKSAIDMAFDPVAFKKTKHIMRDAEYLRDVVAREMFVPRHVSSAEQIADAFTKPLPRPTFVALRDMIVQKVSS